MEGSCERSVFATPESVAAATAYMSARLSLLADAHDFTARRDPGYEAQIAGLRRTVAADRFGLASQVLSVRDGCTGDACDAFGLVYDDKKLRANLKDRQKDVYDRLVTKWLEWNQTMLPELDETSTGGITGATQADHIGTPPATRKADNPGPPAAR